MSMVGKGIIPQSWTVDVEATKLANEALYFCRHRSNGRAASVTVYRRGNTPACLGRCWRKTGTIVLNKSEGLETLAHEVAHMGYSAHSVRHAQLTETILNWMKTKTSEVK